MELKKGIILFTSILSVIGIQAQQKTFKFDFGSGPLKPGYTKVLPSTLYSPATGFGFEPGAELIEKKYPGKDALRDDCLTSGKPFYFSVKLPDGNYNVKVLSGDREGPTIITIKAECRRLMVEKAESRPGNYITNQFTVHVRDTLIAGTGNKVRIKQNEKDNLHWDDKLTIEFNNVSPNVCAVEITPDIKTTTVFLAGNSTVVDQAREPWAAWGQMIPSFFRPGVISVANYAESGETLLAFKREKRLEKIWSLSKPGDYLFIEFTHNDQKPGGNHLDAFTTYKATLKEWITEAKKRSVIPVLVTSMHRRSFDSAGHILNTLEGYPEAMRQTAKEENVALIDLNAMSKVLYEAWGPETSVKAFVHYPANTFPGQTTALKDNTHFSTYGAYELAKCVAKGIRGSIPGLAKKLKPDLPEFDPASPDPVESWNLPLSLSVAATKPDGN